MQNPLLENFNTKHHSAPFNEIKEAHFLPAFQELIKISEKEIDDIVENNEEPSFENVIEALAYSGEKLDVVSSIFFNLNSAETNDEIQKIAQEVSPLLTEFSAKISQNEKLFSKIKKVYEEQQKYQLNEEQQMLLSETYKGFVRSGALLNETDKEKFKEISIELSKNRFKFGQKCTWLKPIIISNISATKKTGQISRSDSSAIPEDAKERNLEGFVVTLEYPSYIPFYDVCGKPRIEKRTGIGERKKIIQQ